MKIITAPSVRPISFPVFIEHPRYRLPAHAEPGENIVAMAGKVCYDSYGVDGRAVDDHVRGLVASGHLSVLEHVHIGLFIEGISRGCSHEIVRHRMFNYSQRSTRYTAEDDAAIVLDPFYAAIYERGGGIEETRLVDDFLGACKLALDMYQRQVQFLESMASKDLTARDRRKWSRGKARQLLPHALETRMVMTGNVRAWRHFLLMRTSRHAEAEIRRLAQAIYTCVASYAPAAFDDLSRSVVHGFLELTEATAV